MKKSKKVLSVILSLSMAFSMSLIQPNYQVKADNSYSVLDSNDNGKEEGAEVTPGLMLRIVMSLLERE